MSDERLHQLIDEALTYSRKDEDELDIADYRSIRRALHSDVLDVVAADSREWNEVVRRTLDRS